MYYGTKVVNAYVNSSVCNNKQIWNGDTCRCDCNEDFASVINCIKEYTWNPSTCECQCDTWCKPRQYLDHKNCVCRLISECTSIINETMMNNDNYDNDDDNDYNAVTYVFIGLFSLLLLVIIYFCVFACFKWFKSKYTNNTIYTYEQR